ncbi:hypothetical protein [Halomonas sp. CSM-2]|uniref:hypothetical protein n=1 Tax=Halomonas sp. CSM-2 TaxID=1975722 RepID=UPI001593C703|nr:hypothetical protein [Halomonas sp. CSM-2]
MTHGKASSLDPEDSYPLLPKQGLGPAASKREQTLAKKMEEINIAKKPQSNLLKA